jgi:hypothetical protein
VNFGGLDIFSIDAVAADVRVGEGDDLAAVARVGQDFLVAGHRRVEHHFTDCVTVGADGNAAKDRAVCECQEGLGLRKQQLGWHRILR